MPLAADMGAEMLRLPAAFDQRKTAPVASPRANLSTNYVPEFTARRAGASGALRYVLQDQMGPDSTFWLLWPSTFRQNSARSSTSSRRACSRTRGGQGKVLEAHPRSAGKPASHRALALGGHAGSRPSANGKQARYSGTGCGKSELGGAGVSSRATRRAMMRLST